MSQNFRRAPAVSVIIPAYNTAEYVRETLESVFQQEFTDFEVLLINDGSPDTPALEAAIAPFRDRIRYIVQENRGLAAARNTGIRLARGAFVALLDSDDVWLPRYLSFQMDYVTKHPKADVVYPNAVTFGAGPDAGKQAMELCPSHGAVTFTSLVEQRCNVRVYALIRRAALIDVGLFDEALRSSEDFDLWLRMAKAGKKICYHREILVRYRIRRGSLTADPVWMCSWIRRVLGKAEHLSGLTSAERAALMSAQKRYDAYFALFDAKRLFFAERYPLARERLREANGVFRSPKLSLTLAVLAIAPGILRRIYTVRDRAVFGHDTTF